MKQIRPGNIPLIKELFKIIEQVCKKQVKIINKSIGTINIKTNILDIKKIDNVIKNDNKISLRDGIERCFKK